MRRFSKTFKVIYFIRLYSVVRIWMKQKVVSSILYDSVFDHAVEPAAHNSPWGEQKISRGML
jgi:hypothetical protein